MSSHHAFQEVDTICVSVIKVLWCKQKEKKKNIKKDTFVKILNEAGKIVNIIILSETSPVLEATQQGRNNYSKITITKARLQV